MFGTAVRHAADSAQPLGRRVLNLVSAVEKFSVFGFHGTLDQLNHITGSTRESWTDEQLSTAAALLLDAHDSWRDHLHTSAREARIAKKRPGYRSVSREERFTAWRDNYFTGLHAEEWRLGETDVVARYREAAFERAQRRAVWLETGRS